MWACLHVCDHLHFHCFLRNIIMCDCILLSYENGINIFLSILYIWKNCDSLGWLTKILSVPPIWPSDFPWAMIMLIMIYTLLSDGPLLFLSVLLQNIHWCTVYVHPWQRFYCIFGKGWRLFKKSSRIDPTKASELQGSLFQRRGQNHWLMGNQILLVGFRGHSWTKNNLFRKCQLFMLVEHINRFSTWVAAQC